MKKKMRYIRTKETDCPIIDTIKYKEITGEDCFIPKNEIVDEANTIEELCDEFVGIDICGHYIIHNVNWIDFARIMPLQKVKYYGAIWTEWGLKYIAKMNDKGELELL